MTSRDRTERQRGQAMTEFVIVTSAILIPLFLVIPFLGKIGEMRQASIQAARYEAWEYTVWNDPADDAMDRNYSRERSRTSFTSSSPPPTLPFRERNDGAAEERVTTLFYYQGGGVGESSPNETLKNGWGDVYRDRPIDREFGSADEDTPDPTTIAGDLLDIADAIASVFDALRFPAFRKLNGNGYQTSEVELALAFEYPSSPFVDSPAGGTGPDVISVTTTARAAVLSDNWGASSTNDAENQTRGLVPTAILGGTIGNVLQSVAGAIAFPFGYPLFGYNGSGNFTFVPPDDGGYYLEFGKVDFDPLPPGAYENDDREVTCGDGDDAPDPSPRVCGFRESTE
ncbi:MAG: hypothetical protein AAGC67_02375 [Myxococcota bacterium]